MSDVRALLAELLHVALSELPLELVLEQALLCVLAIPWLTDRPGGAIYLLDRGVLHRAVQYDISLPASLPCEPPSSLGVTGWLASLPQTTHDSPREPASRLHWVPLAIPAQLLGAMAVQISPDRGLGALDRHMLVSVADALAGVITRERAEAGWTRLARAIEQSGEAIVITDDQGIVMHLNPAVERLWARRRDDLLGQPIQLPGGPELDAVAAALWTAIRRGEPWSAHISHLRGFEDVVHLDLSSSPVFDERSQLSAHVITARDNTQEVQLEAQLRHKQKMDALGRLAGGVAHDFNNILSVILSCSEFLADSMLEGDPLREDAVEIGQAARRATSLTRQLLAFSRHEPTRPVVLDLNQIVADTDKMIRRLVGEHIQVVRHACDDPRPVLADRSHLEQVLVNLVVNARDAMPQGGTLTLATSETLLGAGDLSDLPDLAPGHYVTLNVTDTGTGIPRELLERVFEPFFTTKEVGKGTGLGLSTVYGIVRQAGGHIHVESPPGKGTTFTIHLPRVDRHELAEPQQVVGAKPPANHATILLVEDDDGVRKMTARMLSHHGFRVIAAQGGERALELARGSANVIDLLLSDVIMPGMPGTEVALRLSELRPEVRVLFMSGHLDDLLAKSGVGAGVVFVRKPFTARELVAKVREALAR